MGSLAGLYYRSQRCCDLQTDLLCCSRLFRSIYWRDVSRRAPPSGGRGASVACMESRTLQGAQLFA